MTELPFRTGFVLGRCTPPSTVFSQPFGKKWSFGVLSLVSKVKHLLRMNLMHGNTDSISHVLILTWPGMTSSLRSHGSVNDITQHISFNQFLLLSFDTKIFHFRRRWTILRANQCYENLPFVLNNLSFRETVPLKTFPWIFPHPN